MPDGLVNDISIPMLSKEAFTTGISAGIIFTYLILFIRCNISLTLTAN